VAFPDLTNTGLFDGRTSKRQTTPPSSCSKRTTRWLIAGLPRRKGYDEDFINDLANFWILAQGKNRNKSNRRPKDYFADVSARELKSALIDPELFNYGQYRRFIRTRGEAILERLEAILGVSNAELAGEAG
jgi:hypothetical protein